MQIGTIAVEALTLLAGIALLLVSARFVTDSAIGAVGLLGLHPAIIGIVIALGTTLPEMTVSVTAVRRKHASMALGTALGSLITNLGLILGLASLAAPIAINGTEGLILAWAVASSLASLAIVRRGRISRKQAWLLLILYVLFAATTVALSRVS
jgi:cation:H+ antiporter